MNSDFEKRLQDQPMREIPRHWRAGILTAAQTPPPWWREWLWPCPRAWAGLAAAWVVIFGMNLATGKSPYRSTHATLAVSRRELQALREQQQMLTRLIFPAESAESQPPKRTPAPRSERRKAVIIG